MADPCVNTGVIQDYWKRIHAGDLLAQDELVRSICERLEQLTRKMLRRFPNVRRWAETGDVMQSALIRLLRSLRQMDAPASMREFYALAAQQLRRELLDLARHYASCKGPGNCQVGLEGGGDDSGAGFEPAAPDDDPGELEQWCAFHREVEKLPAEEREVVGLIFYHGWKQADVAELFQVTERTVRRRWSSAMVKLHQAFGGGGPGPANFAPPA
jgi:RNA polymerase sigma-70 factor (ECF subfamily)